MALHLTLDARLDLLADPLIDEIAAAPEGPLATDIVLVPSLGVARWLAQRMAQRRGISAGWCPELPGRYLWRVLTEVFPELPARSPFDASVSRFTLMALLGAVPERPELDPLRRRLACASAADRFRLAEAIAAHFDRYLAYRRDWLERWQAGRWAVGDAPVSPHEGWQRWLWVELLGRLPGVSARHPFDRLRERLADPAFRALPAWRARRVMLFGTLAMSPEQFSWFGALARWQEIHVFAPDPCREFWQDMVTPAARAQVALLRPDEAWLYEGEPAVLPLWGRAQRDFGVQVLSLADQSPVDIDEPLRDREHPFADRQAAAPARPGVLQALQLAVFLASDEPWTRCAGPDRSLRVHATHGAMRSAQVLHDELLACFDEDPSLCPHEVVVYCANLDAALPAIEAAFASAPAARRMPLSVSGHAAQVDPVWRAIGELFRLVRLGTTLTAVTQWLDNPALLEVLGLDDAGLIALTDLFREAGARRGVALTSAPSSKHVWQAAFDRLMLGAAIGPRPEVLGDTLAVPGVAAGSGEPIAPWWRVMTVLERLEAAIGGPMGVSQWCALADELAGHLFSDPPAWRDSLRGLREALARVREDAAHEAQVLLDAEAFEHLLGQALDAGSPAATPGSGITVCPLGALRGVPFRVTVLFGMDDGAWPRARFDGEFDLLSRKPRFGDRLARTDDRGVFLDAVLATHDRLLVIHQGRDPRDDAVLNPSQVVTELLEYLRARLPTVPETDWVRVAALHRFSPGAFRGDDAGFDAGDFAAAHALVRPLATRAEGIGPVARMAGRGDLAAAAGSMPPRADDPPEWSIAELARDLAEPLQTWWRHRLPIALPRQGQAIDDDDLVPEGLRPEAAHVLELALGLLSDADIDELERRTAAWPDHAPGEPGRYQARQDLVAARRLLAHAVAALSEKTPDKIPTPGWWPPEAGEIAPLVLAREPGDLVVTLDGTRLRSAALRFPSRGLQLVLSPYPVRARLWIETWLADAIARLADPSREWCTLGVGLDGAVRARVEEAPGAIAHALSWRRRIAERPWPLFPDVWLSVRKKSGEALDEAIEAALTGNDRHLRGALRGRWAAAFFRDAAPDVADVAAVGEAVCGPIFSACVGSGART